MTELKAVTKIVKAILEADAKTRNNDSYLYVKVLGYIADRRGYDLHLMSVDHFFRYKADYPFFPGFETVRRARQKIQRAYPELKASEAVEEYRLANEEKYRAYAVSKGGI